MRAVLLFFLFFFFLSACSQGTEIRENTAILENETMTKNNQYEKATFAGGCFWCMEAPFEKIESVQSVISGYTGGELENPKYEEVLTCQNQRDP